MSSGADSWFCAGEGCEWSEGEWQRVARLANPPAPDGRPPLPEAQIQTIEAWIRGLPP
jgi:hypothetical protein